MISVCDIVIKKGDLTKVDAPMFCILKITGGIAELESIETLEKSTYPLVCLSKIAGK